MNRDDDCCHGGHGVGIVFRIIFGILVFSVVISVIFGVLYYPMGGMMFPSHWFWGLLGFLFVLWVISWIFRPWHHRRYWDWDHWHDSGREVRILRHRYARGDITEAEFKRMMKVLREEESENEKEETKSTAPSRRRR